MYISYGSLVHLTPYQNRNDAFIPLSIYYSLTISHRIRALMSSSFIRTAGIVVFQLCQQIQSYLTSLVVRFDQNNSLAFHWLIINYDKLEKKERKSKREKHFNKLFSSSFFYYQEQDRKTNKSVYFLKLS